MFKDNLMMLRKMRGMTQEELAEKIDVSRQTLSKYETGESLPDVEKSRLIAEVLDVTLDELVNYEGGETRLPFPPKGKHAFGMVTPALLLNSCCQSQPNRQVPTQF